MQRILRVGYINSRSLGLNSSVRATKNGYRRSCSLKRNMDEEAMMNSMGGDGTASSSSPKPVSANGEVPLSKNAMKRAAKAVRYTVLPRSSPHSIGCTKYTGSLARFADSESGPVRSHEARETSC